MFMSVSGNGPHDTGDNAVGRRGDEDDIFGTQKRKKKRSYHGFARKFARAKQFLLCSTPSNSGRRRPISCRDNGVAGNRSCLFCFISPTTVELPADSHSSDPNDPAFTHDMLRALLEKNDFYSKDCNPHLDVDNLPPVTVTGTQ